MEGDNHAKPAGLLTDSQSVDGSANGEGETQVGCVAPLARPVRQAACLGHGSQANRRIAAGQRRHNDTTTKPVRNTRQASGIAENNKKTGIPREAVRRMPVWFVVDGFATCDRCSAVIVESNASTNRGDSEPATGSGWRSTAPTDPPDSESVPVSIRKSGRQNRCR